jgi:DNA-binding SARP family transcriptional activator
VPTVEVNVEVVVGIAEELNVRLLGPLKVARAGEAIALPASRKVRAMLAWLALSPVAATRSRLCELFWETPSDPRAELRWCLSKVRGIVGGGRVQASGETVRLDLSGCFVDALAAARAQGQLQGLAHPALDELARLFTGDFLEGEEPGRCPGFDGWLLAQRRRFRALHAAILERRADTAPAERELRCLEDWVRHAPYDHRAQSRLLAALARRGRIREGEEHLGVTARRFADVGLDGRALRDAWRAALSFPARAAA